MIKKLLRERTNLIFNEDNIEQIVKDIILYSTQNIFDDKLKLHIINTYNINENETYKILLQTSEEIKKLLYSKIKPLARNVDV
jgi:hypothetical protein